MGSQVAIQTRGRRLMVNPLATALFLIALIASSAALPRWSFRDNSTASRIFLYLFGAGYPRVTFAHPMLIAERTPSGVLIHVPDRDSGWDDLAETLHSRPQDLLQFTFVSGSHRDGLWALTRQTDFANLQETTFGDSSGFPPAELAEARQLVASICLREGWATESQAAALLQGGMQTSRILWPGYAHNALTLLALAGFLYSLQWIPPTLKHLRTSRRDRRLAQNKCPACGYDTAALRADICPECGNPLTHPQHHHPG